MTITAAIIYNNITKWFNVEHQIS